MVRNCSKEENPTTPTEKTQNIDESPLATYARALSAWSRKLNSLRTVRRRLSVQLAWTHAFPKAVVPNRPAFPELAVEAKLCSLCHRIARRLGCMALPCIVLVYSLAFDKTRSAFPLFRGVATGVEQQHNFLLLSFGDTENKFGLFRIGFSSAKTETVVGPAKKPKKGLFGTNSCSSQPNNRNNYRKQLHTIMQRLEKQFRVEGKDYGETVLVESKKTLGLLMESSNY